MEMHPADRTGLHWQLAATEREALFDACERFLAEAAATRARSAPPTRPTLCPDCGHRLGHQYRLWRGAVLCCRRCGWERPTA
jgi:hypothetical protein